MLTAEIVRRLIDYDPHSGGMWWRVDRHGKARAGMRATRLKGDGYLQVKVCGRLYAAHRVAWLHFYGVWPEGDLDHINGDPADNRITNLRIANDSLNAANRRAHSTSASGIKGVSRLPSGRWRAAITFLGRRHHLGVYDTPDEASSAYFAKARELFGDFARAG